MWIAPVCIHLSDWNKWRTHELNSYFVYQFNHKHRNYNDKLSLRYNLDSFMYRILLVVTEDYERERSNLDHYVIFVSNKKKIASHLWENIFNREILRIIYDFDDECFRKHDSMVNNNNIYLTLIFKLVKQLYNLNFLEHFHLESTRKFSFIVSDFVRSRIDLKIKEEMELIAKMVGINNDPYRIEHKKHTLLKFFEFIEELNRIETKNIKIESELLLSNKLLNQDTQLEEVLFYLPVKLVKSFKSVYKYVKVCRSHDPLNIQGRLLITQSRISFIPEELFHHRSNISLISNGTVSYLNNTDKNKSFKGKEVNNVDGGFLTKSWNIDDQTQHYVIDIYGISKFNLFDIRSSSGGVLKTIKRGLINSYENLFSNSSLDSTESGYQNSIFNALFIRLIDEREFIFLLEDGKYDRLDATKLFNRISFIINERIDNFMKEFETFIFYDTKRKINHKSNEKYFGRFKPSDNSVVAEYRGDDKKFILKKLYNIDDAVAFDKFIYCHKSCIGTIEVIGQVLVDLKRNQFGFISLNRRISENNAITPLRFQMNISDIKHVEVNRENEMIITIVSSDKIRFLGGIKDEIMIVRGLIESRMSNTWEHKESLKESMIKSLKENKFHENMTKIDMWIDFVNEFCLGNCFIFSLKSLLNIIFSLESYSITNISYYDVIGIPKSIRMHLWCHTINTKGEVRFNHGENEQEMSRSNPFVLDNDHMTTEKTNDALYDKFLEEEIEKDVRRTNLFKDYHNEEINTHVKQILSSILFRFAKEHVNIGYSQGMNFLAYLVILNVLENPIEHDMYYEILTERCYVLFSALVENIIEGSVYSHSIFGSIKRIEIFSKLFRITLPRIYRHLINIFDNRDNEMNLILTMLTIPWLNTVFVPTIPNLGFLSSLFDCLFMCFHIKFNLSNENLLSSALIGNLEGISNISELLLIFLSLSLLKINQNFLIQLSSEDEILSYLKDCLKEISNVNHHTNEYSLFGLNQINLEFSIQKSGSKLKSIIKEARNMLFSWTQNYYNEEIFLDNSEFDIFLFWNAKLKSFFNVKKKVTDNSFKYTRERIYKSLNINFLDCVPFSHNKGNVNVLLLETEYVNVFYEIQFGLDFLDTCLNIYNLESEDKKQRNKICDKCALDHNAETSLGRFGYFDYLNFWYRITIENQDFYDRLRGEFKDFDEAFFEYFRLVERLSFECCFCYKNVEGMYFEKMEIHHRRSSCLAFIFNSFHLLIFGPRYSSWKMDWSYVTGYYQLSQNALFKLFSFLVEKNNISITTFQKKYNSSVEKDKAFSRNHSLSISGGSEYSEDSERSNKISTGLHREFIMDIFGDSILDIGSSNGELNYNEFKLKIRYLEKLLRNEIKNDIFINWIRNH